MSTIYCTLADLEASVTRRRLIEATDDENPTSTGEIDQVKVDEAIGRAGDMIDSYIGKRYPLPLPSIPTLLKRLAVDLAIHNLFARVQDGEMSQGVRDRKNDAIRLLELLQRGDASLGIGVNEPAPIPVGPVTSGQSAWFPDNRLNRMDSDMGPWGSP